MRPNSIFTSLLILAGLSGALSLKIALTKTESTVQVEPGDQYGKKGQLIVWRKYSPHPFKTPLILIAWASFGAVYMGRKYLAIKPLLEDVKTGLESISEELILSGQDVAKSSLKIAIQASPIPLPKTWIESVNSDNGVIDRFLSAPHQRIAGQTGSGKTVLSKMVVAKWFERNPDSSIVILDPNYGKPDSQGKLNDWNGLNPAFIHSDYDSIQSAIKVEYDLLKTRIADSEKKVRNGIKQIELPKPRIIIIDEIDSLFEYYNRNKLDFISYLTEIIKQGRGYRIKVLIIGQSLAVGASGINLSLSKQLGTMLLIKGKIPDSELTYLGISDKSDLREKIAQINRPAIAQLEGAVPEVVNIPDLSEFDDLSFSDGLDPDKIWWDSVDKTWLEDLAIDYRNGGKSPLKDACKKLGIEVRSDDPRYINFFKPYWQSLLGGNNEK